MYPIHYIDPVFRPPSEARSLILQVTNGCSWNKCTFCDMYKEQQKQFKTKPIEHIDAELQQLSDANYPVRRVFLADGDAMALSTRRLRDILERIKKHFPDVQRISSYCSPRNVIHKSVEELQGLRELGLEIVYVGCESGDDKLLELIEKGETFESSLKGLLKIKQAGLKSSIMLLNGLGGPELSEQHMRASAKLMNEVQPEYLSSLVVNFPPGGEEPFNKNFRGHWRKLHKEELFREMEILLSSLQLHKTIFRSDHASNYLVLKGILGRDKEKLLNIVRTAIHQPGVIPLRPERLRGL